MSVELLYIVPAVMIAAFGFILVRIFQSRHENNHSDKDLEREVDSFNSGAQLDQVLSQKSSDQQRMNEFEQKISTIARSLATQQKVIKKFQRENSAYQEENAELKKKLHDAQRDYDILLSENYTLRAKIKRLLQEMPGDILQDFQIHEADPGVVSTTSNPSMEQDGYERRETRVAGLGRLEETSEIDLTELQ